MDYAQATVADFCLLGLTSTNQLFGLDLSTEFMLLVLQVMNADYWLVPLNSTLSSKYGG